MSNEITRRISIIIGSVALLATLTMIGGVASAAPTSAPKSIFEAGHAATHNSVTVPIGTDNLYDNMGGPLVEDGTMTLNSNGTWSLSLYGDSGFWTVSGNTIYLADTFISSVWIAKIGKHGLASAKKPGMVTEAGQSTPSFKFYTIG